MPAILWAWAPFWPGVAALSCHTFSSFVTLPANTCIENAVRPHGINLGTAC
ncbi:MAG: hypothetical protein IT258_05730 [Saprospiraceae bacterium]|nr:hypothetical protein [Saprospiraceae bacterium]